MASRGRSLAEQETVIRFDRASASAALWTAAPGMAAKWTRQGYPVRADGAGWRAEVPINVLTFRRLSQKPREREKRPVPPGFLHAKTLGGIQTTGEAR